MRIQAAVMERAGGLVAKHQIRIEEVELEGPRDDEALIRVTSCGVCGTGRGCIRGQMPYPAPSVLGHEGAGVVEAAGRGCGVVKTGDRVIIGFPFCGACMQRRGGRPRYCLLEARTRLQAQGRLPLEGLARTYPFTDINDINQAIDDSDSGEVVKPILHMAA